MLEPEKKKSNLGKSLRVVSPKLYNTVITELEKLNIHQYDIQANAVEEETGIQIIIRFGEGFTQKQTQFFSYHAIKNESPTIVEFIKKLGENCKQVMVADYFKMMKP